MAKVTLRYVGSCIWKDGNPFAICSQLNMFYQLCRLCIMYTGKSTSPSTDPWGTPTRILRVLFLKCKPQWPPVEISSWGSLQFMGWFFQIYLSCWVFVVVCDIISTCWPWFRLSCSSWTNSSLVVVSHNYKHEREPWLTMMCSTSLE